MRAAGSGAGWERGVVCRVAAAEQHDELEQAADDDVQSGHKQ
jgi:hypothetical protein